MREYMDSLISSLIHLEMYNERLMFRCESEPHKVLTSRIFGIFHSFSNVYFLTKQQTLANYFFIILGLNFYMAWCVERSPSRQMDVQRGLGIFDPECRGRKLKTSHRSSLNKVGKHRRPRTTVCGWWYELCPGAFFCINFVWGPKCVCVCVFQKHLKSD